jgi:hypothetical protein
MKEALNSSKRRFLQEPHGVTSQKTPFCIVTAVKSSSLTLLQMLEGVGTVLIGKNMVSLHLQPLLMEPTEGVPITSLGDGSRFNLRNFGLFKLSDVLRSQEILYPKLRREEMKIFLRSKARTMLEANTLTAICDLILKMMWDSQLLAAL